MVLLLTKCYHCPLYAFMYLLLVCVEKHLAQFCFTDKIFSREWVGLRRPFEWVLL